MIERIGKYEIQAEIGRGGFGQVYRAFDPTVGRHVAIKVLSSASDRDLVSRFRNEASTAGKLRHKNIVTIFDFGEYTGTPYIVMELLEGLDLQRVIAERTPLMLLQKIRIMAQVAQGLHAAHQTGLVHRDIKPANVMLLNDGTAKIMDFGIARLTQDASTRLTQKGSLIGSVRYMSPEQFHGHDTDALCDIWSYGVIYYELLTSEHPFGSASEPAALMYNITNSDAKPLRSLLPSVPEAIENLVHRAIAKDRDSRYQSAEDLYFDVEPVLLEMQRERAAHLLKEAEAFAANQRLQDATPLIREILDLDPGNARARQLREIAHARPSRKPMVPVVDALVKTGEQELAGRRFAEAIHNLESALKLDATNSQIRILLDQALSMQERSGLAERLLDEARSNLEHQNLTVAYNKVSRALETDPDNTVAKTLLQVIWHEIEQREGPHGTVLTPAVVAKPRVDPPPVRPSAPGINRRRLFLTAGITALIFIGAALALPRIFRKDSGGFEIRTAPAGATIRVGDRACVTPGCKLDLAPGSYQLEARLDGYQRLVRSFTVTDDVPVPLDLALDPLPASVVVSSNFESGKVSLNGRPIGDLRDGQFSLNSILPGKHVVKVAGRDGQVSVIFDIAPGKPPTLNGSLDAPDVQAISVANLGTRARLDSNISTGVVTVDGKPAGQAGTAGLELEGFTEGAHDIRIGERSVVAGTRTVPTLTLFLFANRAAAAQHVPIAKTVLKQPEPPPVPRSPLLSVRGALPGTQVSLDGRLLGATDADGNFSATVPAGDHNVEFSKDRHTPRRLLARFEPDKTVQFARGDVELAELPPPPQPKPVQQQPPPPQVQPTPPPKPDPRVIEAQAWEQVRNSRDIATLEDFRRKHPGSTFAEQAARRIEQLESEAAKLAQTQKAAAEQQAIRQTLARYAAAYQNRDADALQAIWPSIPARTLASIRSSFKSARSISLELNPVAEAVIVGDGATVSCQRTLQQNFGDKPLQNQDTITLKLRRQGASWVIESIQ